MMVVQRNLCRQGDNEGVSWQIDAYTAGSDTKQPVNAADPRPPLFFQHRNDRFAPFRSEL